MGLKFLSIMVLLLVSLPESAQAVTHSETAYIGLEPQRLLPSHPSVQAQHLQSPEFQRFIQAQDGEWFARFDEATGTPFRLWGSGIPVHPKTETDAADAFIALLRAHDDLFGIEHFELQIKQSNYSKEMDTFYIDVSVLHQDIPIYRGEMTGRIKHGRLIMMGGYAYPNVPIQDGFSIPKNEAIRRAITLGPASASHHDALRATKQYLPQFDALGLRLVGSWQVTSRTQDPPGKWVSFIDGESGELMNVHNEVRFISGDVFGKHDERTVDGSPLVTTALPLMYVEGPDETATTDADGHFQFKKTEPEEFSLKLRGPYLLVFNETGEDAELVTDSPNILWTNQEASQAEISVFAFLHHVQAWGQRLAPEVDAVSDSIRAYVNIDEACNAYYDGDINFYRAGSGCNNTGRIADVNYHEWGHAFHYESIEAGWFDGSLSEGAADTIAFLQTHDSEIAPYFYNNGSGIRDVEPDRIYPDQFSTSEYSVHSNGLIFGGTMWDLWKHLSEIEGEEAGTLSTEEILVGLLKGGPDIPGAYFEAIVADDDDGNLANGTPHQCELIEIFGSHGLGPLGDNTLFVASHIPSPHHPVGNDHEIEATLINAASTCYSYDPQSAWVSYRINGGPWETATMEIDGDLVLGAIPEQPIGTLVEYYISVEDISSVIFSAPVGGIIQPYSFYVGDVLEVYCDDFEIDDGGFSHELLGGTEEAGADDWQWGAPQGLGGDPSRAHSGLRVWGNDLGDDIYNGEYQNDKHNRLSSPEINMRHYDGAFLHYYRWLTVEDGLFDQAQVLINDHPIWDNWASEETGAVHHIDSEWSPQSIDISTAADEDTIQISFDIMSDGGLTFGGWNIDDVCVYAPDTPDNRLGISDLKATSRSDHVELKWTNPLHEPLENIALVRRPDRFPSSPQDGWIVHYGAAPNVNSIVTVRDPFIIPGKTYYYAVYANNGTQWLSWTREGKNATIGVRGVPAPPSGLAGTCGCQSTQPKGFLLAGLALLLLPIFRRKRPLGMP